MEQLTTKCNVSINGKVLLQDKDISITFRLCQKTQLMTWVGLLHLIGEDSTVFITTIGEPLEIELNDGRKGKFYATNIGTTANIKGIGPLE